MVDFFYNKKLFSNQRCFSHKPQEISLTNKMNNSKADNIFLSSNYFMLAVISLIALIVTFLVSNSKLGFEMKSAVFFSDNSCLFGGFCRLLRIAKAASRNFAG